MALAEGGAVYAWRAGYKDRLDHGKSWSQEDQADEPNQYIEDNRMQGKAGFQLEACIRIYWTSKAKFYLLFAAVTVD